MRKIAFLFLALMSVQSLSADKVAELPDVMKPVSISIDGNELYIIENRIKISVFSLSDHRFLRDIAKKGEGPGEFRYNPTLKVLSHSVFLGAVEKIMKFSKQGKLIEEKRLIPLGRALPAGESYVSIGTRNEADTNFVTVNLLNSDLKKTKELYRQERFGRRGIVSPIRDYLGFDTYEDRIYIAEGRKGFFFEVFNSRSERLYDIEKKLKKIKITNDYKDTLVEQLVNRPGGAGAEWRVAIERFRVEYPKYFPDIRSFIIADGKIYVETYKGKEGKTEFIILDIHGDALKRVSLPLFEEGSLVEKHIFTFSQDAYFYLKYNDEKELWELHEIKL